MNEDRMDVLEGRVLELEREIAELRNERTWKTERPAPRPAPAPRPTPVPARPAAPAPRPDPVVAATPRRPLTMEEILSPRNLAVAGGIAVLAGLVFLVSYGISNGWISEEVRVIGAAVFSALLAAGGVFLREYKKLAAPAEALVVVGLAGLFVSLVAATRLYDLIGPVPALVVSAGIGALGLGVGLIWRSEVIATAVLGGALLAPLMVGAEYSPDLLVFLVPVFAAAVAAALIRPWRAIFPIAAALFLGSLLAAVADAEQGSTIGAFALSLLTLLLVTAGSVGRGLRIRALSIDLETLVFGVFFSLVTVLGTFLVTGSEHPLVECSFESGCGTHLTFSASLWLFTSGLAAAGIWWLARAREQRALAVTAFALGSASVAGGLGLLFDGSPLLTLAWSLEAACLIALGENRWQRLVGIGVLAAAILCALIQVPLDVLSDGTDSLARDLGVLAPLLVPLGALAWRERDGLGEVGAGAAVTVLTYMGLIACGSAADPGSVLNLLPLCLAATVPLCLTDRVWAWITLACFGFAAVVFSFGTAIPLDALVNGVPSAAEAAAAGAMIVAAAAALAWKGPERLRQASSWCAVGATMYLVSALIIDGFQGGVAIDGELPKEAQGQVIVSSLWALTGLALVVAGLVRSRLSWRKAGLILLILSLAKISLYDLASLSTAGRTISFILVGLVLLAAAFAYQWMNRRGERETVEAH